MESIGIKASKKPCYIKKLSKKLSSAGLLGWSKYFNNNFPPKNNLISGPINSAIEKVKIRIFKIFGANGN